MIVQSPMRADETEGAIAEPLVVCMVNCCYRNPERRRRWADNETVPRADLRQMQALWSLVPIRFQRAGPS